MTPLISFNQVDLHLDNKHLLKNIDFQLTPSEAGSHLVIFGPNGAGKTLLVQLLSGNLDPTSGEVKVFNNSLQAKNSHETKKQIGFVSPKLFDDYSYDTKVTDVVISGLFGSIGICQDPTKASNKVVKDYITKVITQKYQHAQADAVAKLDQMHIAHLADQEFGHLSYGQKNRVLIARALISNPKLLILDEPTTGLDLNVRAEFSAIVHRLAQETSIVYITHHIEEILPDFHNILYLKEGQIFKYGLKENLLTSNYLTELLEVPVTIHQKQEKYFAMF